MYTDTPSVRLILSALHVHRSILHLQTYFSGEDTSLCLPLRLTSRPFVFDARIQMTNKTASPAVTDLDVCSVWEKGQPLFCGLQYMVHIDVEWRESFEARNMSVVLTSDDQLTVATITPRTLFSISCPPDQENVTRRLWLHVSFDDPLTSTCVRSGRLFDLTFEAPLTLSHRVHCIGHGSTLLHATLRAPRHCPVLVDDTLLGPGQEYNLVLDEIDKVKSLTVSVQPLLLGPLVRMFPQLSPSTQARLGPCLYLRASIDGAGIDGMEPSCFVERLKHVVFICCDFFSHDMLLFLEITSMYI